MEKEEITIKSRELIKKLTEKLDKCRWREDDKTKMYILSFEGIGSIHLDRQLLIVFNKNGDLVMENVPTKEEGDAYNHIVLWGKINKKDTDYKEKHLDILIKELDKLE